MCGYGPQGRGLAVAWQCWAVVGLHVLGEIRVFLMSWEDQIVGISYLGRSFPCLPRFLLCSPVFYCEILSEVCGAE